MAKSIKKQETGKTVVPFVVINSGSKTTTHKQRRTGHLTEVEKQTLIQRVIKRHKGTLMALAKT